MAANINRYQASKVPLFRVSVLIYFDHNKRELGQRMKILTTRAREESRNVNNNKKMPNTNH